MTAEDERWSDTWAYADGERYRLTWRDVARRQREELQRLRKWATIAEDLDRCEHGRHEGDVCGSCNGRSVGNKLIGHGPIGHTMGGSHIFSPPRSIRHDPDAWLVGGGPCSVNNGGRCPINPTVCAEGGAQ